MRTFAKIAMSISIATGLYAVTSHLTDPNPAYANLADLSALGLALSFGYLLLIDYLNEADSTNTRERK